MVLAVFYQVLGRYIFSYKLGAAAETATFAQIWMILLASGIAMRKNMHVGVDILLRKLSVKNQKIVITASTIIIMVFEADATWVWLLYRSAYSIKYLGVGLYSESLALHNHNHSTQ